MCYIVPPLYYHKSQTHQLTKHVDKIQGMMIDNNARRCAVVLFLYSYYDFIVQAQVLQENQTCKVVTFIPFTDLRKSPTSVVGEQRTYYGYGTWPDSMTLAKESYSLMAAAEIARRHFNARDTSVVSELGNPALQYDQCNITIPPHLFLNSAYDRRTSVIALQSLLDDTREILGTSENACCAVIGPVDIFGEDGVSIITESLRIPQLAFETINSKLSSREEYPTLARVIPDAYDFGLTFAHFFHRDIWKREAIGVLYEKNDYGLQFLVPIDDMANELGFELYSQFFFPLVPETIESALKEFRERGYRTILLITDKLTVIDDTAYVADSLNMTGDGYFWMLTNEAIQPKMLQSLRYHVDSPTDKLLRGAAVFTNYDPFVYSVTDKTNTFTSSWRNQTSSFVTELNQMQPIDAHGNPFYVASNDYFQAEVPTVYSSFMYDAIIAIGISACRTSSNHASHDSALSHIEQVFTSNFIGASGAVEFKRNGNIYRNSRDPKTVPFGIYNIRPGEIDNVDEKRSYDSVLTYLYERDEPRDVSRWRMADDNIPFIFYDGTANEPLPRREVADANYLSKGVQNAGFVLSSFALCFVIVSGTLVLVCRNHSLIRASQPTFLFLLCFGAALVAPSSILLSFDEGKGLSTEQLSKMCSTFPWIFVLGYLTMFGALFCKLWRLSKLLQIRRVTVKAKQVLWPYFLIMVCALVILIVWQIIDPFIWVRMVTSEPGAPYETFGECSSVQYGKSPFITAIGFVIFLAVTTTLYFSWKLRNVQSDLAETRWIFTCICLHLQMWLVGAPVFYITYDVSRDASYLMVVVLTFTFSVSQVGLVIVPKLLEIYRNQTLSSHTSMSPRISIAGPTTFVSGFSSRDSSNRDFSNFDTAIQNVALLSRIEELETQVRQLKSKLGIDSKESTSPKSTRKNSTSSDTKSYVNDRDRMHSISNELELEENDMEQSIHVEKYVHNYSQD